MIITGLHRERNTPDGNPVWRVYSDAGSWRTVPDGQVGHLISSEWIGREVSITLDQLHRISHIREEAGA